MLLDPGNKFFLWYHHAAADFQHWKIRFMYQLELLAAEIPSTFAIVPALRNSGRSSYVL